MALYARNALAFVSVDEETVLFAVLLRCKYGVREGWTLSISPAGSSFAYWKEYLYIIVFGIWVWKKKKKIPFPLITVAEKEKTRPPLVVLVCLPTLMTGRGRRELLTIEAQEYE